MKLDFSSDNSAVSFVDEEIASTNGQSENGADKEDNKTLRAGIKAAQRGDRAEARQLLLRVTEAEPHNESAWLWLASISEYPEELLIFLNNVLDINPENERAVEWAKATKSLLAKTFVQRGIEAHNQEQTQFARQCFMQAIVHDNRNELAWLWLASVTDAVEEKIAHFHRVLEVNPENETARESIRSAREKMMQAALAKAENAVDNGDFEKAEMHLGDVFGHNPQHEAAWFLKTRMTDSYEEKMACFEKMLEFNPANEKARDAMQKAQDERTADFFARANEAANDGNREQANEFLTEVFNQNPHHEDAWILKSRMTDSFEEKIECFEKILEFNPANETAQAGVKLRAMLNGNAPKAEPATIFPNEEIVEQLDEEQFNAAEPMEDFGAHENREAENFEAESFKAEDFETEQPMAEAEQAEKEEENSSFALFQSEMTSATEQSNAFDYFGELEKSSEPETAAAQFSSESEMWSSEPDSREDAQNFSFEDQPAESSADEHQGDFHFSSEEEKAQVNEAEFIKPEDVFAEYAENYGVENFSNDGDDDEFFQVDSADVFVKSETNHNGFHAEAAEEEMNFFGDAVEVMEEPAANEMPHMADEKPSVELKNCPFCMETNEVQAFVCRSCRSLLTLSDIEMILAYTEADTEVLRNAVEQMEAEDSQRGLESEEFLTLAIGHINLKNLRKGLDCLQKASKLDPNNVVIESQANSLAIRLSEIEEMENVQSALPKDRTIMVVDDSATVRKLISGKLEKCGHVVITAVDGMDAMAKLNDVVPDLILLDITMPRMDGYQVCKLIRNNNATKEVPIVMISGKDGFFDKVRGRMAGTTGYITKPFGPETLMKMLDTYLVQ